MRRTGKRVLALLAVGAALALGACKGGKVGGGTAASTVALESEDEKTLYALGVSVGKNISRLDLSPDEIGIVQAGLQDGASGAEPRVEVQEYGPKINTLAEARAKVRAEAEKERSKEFLAAAGEEAGAETTASGLIYLETQKGTGATPKASDRVSVHYRGTLTDGTQFDSSYDRGEPVEFPLGSVIPCWGEGLQKMAVGGKAKLICPSSIAYGDSGRPPVIPPGATLVFEVELLGIAGS